MGVLTLADFRTDVGTALGSQGRPTFQLDRWVNQGYLDVVGAVDFDVFDQYQTVPTVADTPDIALPVGTVIVKTVKDETSDVNLGWIPQAEYFRRKVTPTGPPTAFTRLKDLIKLNPVPDAIYSLLVITKKDPDSLVQDNDVTAIPSTWDTAVFLLAVHHAWLTLNQEQRAAVWLGRAVTYMQSRITEKDFYTGITGLEKSIAGYEARLTQMQQ